MKRNELTSTEFDHRVRALTSAWETAIELQQEWESLDGEQRLALTEDWPLNNVIQRELEDYASKHELTEDQQAQYTRLKQIIDKHVETLLKMGYRVLSPERRRHKAVA